MQLAGHVRESEIRRLERRKTLALVRAQAEVPGGERFIVGDRLIHQLRKGEQVEERRAGVLADELACTRLRDRKAELVAADALRLQLEARRACQIGGGNPKLSGIAGSDLGGDVVINDGGPALFGVNRQRPEEENEGGDCGPCCDQGIVSFSGREYTQKQ